MGWKRSSKNQTAIALWLMLGIALKNLPPKKRRIVVCQDDIDRLIKGQKRPFRIGFQIDEKTYKRKWVTMWGDLNPESVGVTVSIQVDFNIKPGKRQFDL
jgi:hypothetical protein